MMIAQTPPLTVGDSTMTVEHRKLPYAPGGAMIHLSRFCGASGVVEAHLTVIPDAAGSIQDHLSLVENAYRSALTSIGLDAQSAVWRRFFCSDIANQASILASHGFAGCANPHDPCAVSYVGQSPLATAKLALWACHIIDPVGPLEKSHDGTTLSLRRGDLNHLWSTNLAASDQASTTGQTHALFTNYVAHLNGRGLTLADAVVRTWLFQPNIDLDYHDMCETRREFFAAHGLTADTHFIASTGIAAAHTLPTTRVFMDAYAIAGLRPQQVHHLSSLDHLGPTYDYGVTFERATAISYQDRTQIWISGTASIDPKGDIVHPGDVVRQLVRVLSNIDGLLAAAGAGLSDMLVFLVYLRDPTDHARILPTLRERLGDAPLVILDAPVCRPGWLIEIEGMATVPACHPELPPF